MAARDRKYNHPDRPSSQDAYLVEHPNGNAGRSSKQKKRGMEPRFS
tara:strand:- start:488 stop:625 length:138 start_codon:yes stop_codon:yes gene_type:complete